VVSGWWGGGTPGRRLQKGLRGKGARLVVVTVEKSSWKGREKKERKGI